MCKLFFYLFKLMLKCTVWAA